MDVQPLQAYSHIRFESLTGNRDGNASLQKMYQISIKNHLELRQNTYLTNLKDYFKQSLHIQKDCFWTCFSPAQFTHSNHKLEYWSDSFSLHVKHVHSQ